MNKNPQYTTILNTRDLFLTTAMARELLSGVTPARTLSVALDMHKNVNLALAVDGRWQVVEPARELLNLRCGLTWLTGQLDSRLNGGEYDLLLLTHEPTGVYHEPWMYALVEQFAPFLSADSHPRLLYRWQNTEAVKLERRQKYHRQRKNDTIDLWAMTTLNLRGEGQPLSLRQGDNLQLTLAVSRLQRLRRNQRQFAASLRRDLDRLWPGALGNAQRFRRAWPHLPPLNLLVGTRPLERQRVRLLLQHCANPHAIRQMDVTQLCDFYRQHGLRCGSVTATHVHNVFTQAVLPPPDLAEALAAQVQADFARYRALEEGIQTIEEVEIAPLIPGSQAWPLLSVPGISPLLAARYLAGIQEWRRFPSANHIWSFAGYDPTFSDSGNRRRTYAISKKGDPYLRDTLFRIGYQMARHCPPVTLVFLRAIQRGCSDVGATIHAGHKANRILFSLLRDQRPFSSPLSPAQAADVQAHMVAYLAGK